MTPQAVLLGDLHNVFQLNERLFSGSAPETAADFAQLRQRGIRTLLSVDGAPPNLALAHQFGLTYLHIPIGYNGTSRSNAHLLVKAALQASGPVYVHCHHGRHRGPVAAALICEATGQWNPIQALAWLQTAGTAPEYPGLFQLVREFQAPSAADLALIPNSFSERIAPSTLVERMVAIDSHWDRLKRLQKEGFRLPSQDPDLDPASDALLLAEGFREAGRNTSSPVLCDSLLQELKQAETKAMNLHRFLQSAGFPLPQGQVEEAQKQWTRMAESCVSCHKNHRN